MYTTHSDNCDLHCEHTSNHIHVCFRKLEKQTWASDIYSDEPNKSCSWSQWKSSAKRITSFQKQMTHTIKSEQHARNDGCSTPSPCCIIWLHAFCCCWHNHPLKGSTHTRHPSNHKVQSSALWNVLKSQGNILSAVTATHGFPGMESILYYSHADSANRQWLCISIWKLDQALNVLTIIYKS